jgi:hypothetical protein
MPSEETLRCDWFFFHFYRLDMEKEQSNSHAGNNTFNQKSYFQHHPNINM